MWYDAISRFAWLYPATLASFGSAIATDALWYQMGGELGHMEVVSSEPHALQYSVSESKRVCSKRQPGNPDRSDRARHRPAGGSLPARKNYSKLGPSGALNDDRLPIGLYRDPQNGRGFSSGSGPSLDLRPSR
ncbi:hypothetical protein B0H19DRAFT_1146227 [Mycena capillaripes]|nr:hypothetical protein B0H19DRAFT_1146227 [Mycena capillaripes]